ncbi:glycogen phosphorylase [Verrucomicrobia bacterium LW23]|nr:glycogen phosphorylase [Verrucomicrobia bacterium LW23]
MHSPSVSQDHSDSVRTGLTAETIRQAFLENLTCGIGRPAAIATKHDLYLALALTVRDRLFQRSSTSVAGWVGTRARTVSYLSAEFLLGPHLANNLLNLGITEAATEAMHSLGYDINEILAQEVEPGLGNGGLGRLAACYMDSLASIEVPALGYGIRYEFGIFDQVIRDGWQCELTDKWLKDGNPWEIARPEISFIVKFGGHTELVSDGEGSMHVRWNSGTEVMGVAYDTPIAGFQVGTCNTLRLWKAEAVESFDFAAFNQSDYYRAVEAKMASETITKVLYPNDAALRGKELRLKQQFFFTSCSLQDMFRILIQQGGTPSIFHEKWTVQLNDTHPAVAVAELMRLLVDVYSLGWEEAWAVTTKSIAYTNHTLLPEALEKWTVDLFGSLLPRHLEIVYEINRRFLEEVRAAFPGDDAKLARLSLIDESGQRYVRMANLACVGSHTINGVAELHSELLKQTVLKDFADLWPEKFCNVTNGVTLRRFVAVSNPGLTNLISDNIGGNGWLKHPARLRDLEKFAYDPEFQQKFLEVKLANKRRLAARILQRTGISVVPDSMFDVLVKRIHEYKRQHLKVLHVLSLFMRLRRDPSIDMPARTFIFGGKAAPGYTMAKLIIKLITATGDLVNTHPAVRDRLKVVFYNDFNVKNAHFIYPAADLSEQISTAGKEASGTGNMKFSLNGALTVGTLDGANVEIREEVGAENFFLFGLTAEEVENVKAQGYKPYDYYLGNTYLREVMDFIAGGGLSSGDKELFRPIVDNLLHHDPYLLLADYQSYINAQDRVSALWVDRAAWAQQAILNTARMGKFSSDRSIRDYCDRIWKVKPGQPA